MEEQLTTPVENTSAEATVDNNQQTVKTNTTEMQQPETAPQTESREVRAQSNWNNGRRRIQQRQGLKARIRELEQQLAQYQGKDDDQSRFYQGQIQDRIDDLNAMNADAEASDFANHAEQFFGEDTDAFMQSVYRYSQYVNENEPDLLKYTQREYGPILLHEWMQRMDNAQLRSQWLGMTAYEKQKVLDNLYRQIGEVIKNYNQQGAKPPVAPKRVPVPNGGRQSPGTEATDDFGIELGNSFSRHKQGQR